jgi:Zn-dependent M28 family amino/carboxypeptidase
MKTPSRALLARDARSASPPLVDSEIGEGRLTLAHANGIAGRTDSGVYMQKLSLALILGALPFIIGAADAPTAEIITPDTMRGHVEFLASDALEGRETGTHGYDVAAEYVASRFRSMGLQPASDKGWFQQVPFVANLVDEQASSMTINGQKFALRTEVRFGPARTAGTESIEGNVVFAGFGIDDPANGQNDYKGLDVKGKIVALLSGFPKGMPSDIGAHYGRSKAKMAEARGAIGVVTISTIESERTRPWARGLDQPQHPSLGWAQSDGSMFTEAPGIRFSAQLGEKAASTLFAGAPKKLTAILAEADKTGGRPKGFALKALARIDRTTSTNSVSSPNVIGMLPGSDPDRAGEYVLLMAHLDHNGIDPTKVGDKIFNGAMDNASGTAAMLEAAHALATGPRPKRPILFAAVTAEERGLLGSDYLARHPVVANGKVVAVVNLDMPVLLYDFQDVIAFGAEHSTMGEAVARAGKSMGIELSPDPLPAEGLFTRSDHYSFVKQGVPSIFLMTGFKNGGEAQFQDFLKTHYHKVSDDLTLPFDWNAAAKFARINTAIADEIANAPSVPHWYSDSFFGKTFAGGAIKAERPKP